TAGQAMTVYALSTAVLAPLTLVLTGSWPRRRALCFGLALFAAGNALCALAPTFPVLLLGRVLMGIGAIFTPISAGIAVAMVEPAQRGRALALVFLGISLSYVIGVPLGAWLGFRFGWQWPIALVAAAALTSSLALRRLGQRPLRRAPHACRPAQRARHDDAAGAVDAGSLRAAGRGVHDLGHGWLRHDDATAVAPRGARSAASADPAVAQFVDAVLRH